MFVTGAIRDPGLGLSSMPLLLFLPISPLGSLAMVSL